MAIDPSISLGFRPPVIPPSQILNPVEQFGQILSLRNLMTQGQLGQLGLQTHQLELRKLQQEMEGQDRINKILAARSAAAAPLQTAPAVPPVTPAAPLSTLMTPQAQAPAAGLITPGNIDLHSRPIVRNPDGSISTVRSASFDQDGKEVLVPTVSDDGRILSNEEAWAQYKKTGKHLGIFDNPQNATAYAQQLHQDQAAEYSPQPAATGAPLSSLMTPQTPTVTPTPPAAPVPGRAPSAAAVSIADPYADLPSDAELIQQGGTAGFAIVKNLNAAREAYYKQQQEKIKLHQEALTGLASLAAGAHDEPSKVEVIAAAFNNKWIDAPMRDELMSHPYNKKEWDGFQVDALGGVKRLQELRDQVNQTALEKKQAHDQAMYPSEEAKAGAEATKAKQEVEGTQPITRYQQAQLQPKTAGDFIRIITDPASTPEQKAAAQKGLDLFGGLAAIEAGARTNVLLSPAKEAQEIRIAGGKAAANPNILDRESARFAKPHEKIVTDANTQLEKINEARAMINGPATAQALGIPKVLSSLVGGAGSGLRMTKAELDAIAKARGIGGDVEGFISKVSGEGVLTKEQQRQLTGLLDDVAERTRQKQAIANDALDRINSATSREEIVAIDIDVRKKLGQMQTGPAAAKLPEITSQAAYDALPKGAQYTHKGEVLTKK